VSKNLIRMILALACMAALVAPARSLSQEVVQSTRAPGSVAGQWSLNRALSDDPADQLMNVRGGAVPPGSGGRPAPSGGRSQFDVVRRAIEGFRIEQTDSTVTIVYQDREVLLFTDGRKQKIAAPDGREVEYHTLWEGPSLQIERRIDGGMTLTEKYSVQAVTGRLHVLTRLEGARLPQTISFMRVYDPAPGAGQDPEDPGN
jgi:hypothetical protein